MALPLEVHANGDIIWAEHVNDIRPYIELGTYRVNTLSLELSNTKVIDIDRSFIINKVAISPNQTHNTIKMYMEVTGDSPTQERALKCKLEDGSEVIISSVLI
jgi:hypothetical protein